MSRIGLKPITIPEGVTVSVKDGLVTVASDKVTLTQEVLPAVSVDVADKQIKLTVSSPSNQARALHGLFRSLVNNMVVGVTEGFQKILELQGTGFRVNPKDKGIELALGFSHPVEFVPPEGITLEVKDQKLIIVSGADKQLVGQVAANIKALKKPDAYKGKGVRFLGEEIKLKPGKAAKAAGE